MEVVGFEDSNSIADCVITSHIVLISAGENKGGPFLDVESFGIGDTW